MTKLIILDNEAAQALADHAHPKHSDALSYAELTRQRKRKLKPIRIIMPTCVRVEVCLDHQTPAGAALNRFGIDDIPLDKTVASVAASIRHQRVDRISVTDAHIGATVRQFAGHDITIISSDRPHMEVVSAPVHVNVQPL